MSKTNTGNFFEDFRLGQTIRHATPRTVTEGDAALYVGLFGARFAVQSSAAFATAVGYRARPIDDLLVFHIVFGKSVPDVSLNAVANLGYANGQFLTPVFTGDSLSATSEVIGLKENSNRKTGIVYVRTRAINQAGTGVLEYVRWVMVRKRDEAAPPPADHVPQLPTAVDTALLGAACRPSTSAPTTSRSPAARTASATTRSAKRSTMSTASRSRRPSTRSRRGSTRTPRAFTSISSPPRRAASAAG
jgi:2-methylfumaryl-CoA hydratase